MVSVWTVHMKIIFLINSYIYIHRKILELQWKRISLLACLNLSCVELELGTWSVSVSVLTCATDPYCSHRLDCLYQKLFLMRRFFSCQCLISPTIEGMLPNKPLEKLCTLKLMRRRHISFITLSEHTTLPKFIRAYQRMRDLRKVILTESLCRHL